jgi:serine/threonine protein kinase
VNVAVFPRHEKFSLLDGNIPAAAIELCRALEYLATVGVAHLDITPSNILRGSNGLLLADFGTARYFGSIIEPNSTTAIEYRPPEGLSFVFFFQSSANLSCFAAHGPGNIPAMESYDAYSVGCVIAGMTLQRTIMLAPGIEYAIARDPSTDYVAYMHKMFVLSGSHGLFRYLSGLSRLPYRFFASTLLADPTQRLPAARLVQLLLEPEKGDGTID